MQINAIKLQPDSPFAWATGWQSPIYSDLRMTLSYPEVRNLIKVEMARLIMENFGGGGHQNVAGTQLKDGTVDEVYNQVLEYTNSFIEEFDNNESNTAEGR